MSRATNSDTTLDMSLNPKKYKLLHWRHIDGLVQDFTGHVQGSV